MEPSDYGPEPLDEGADVVDACGYADATAPTPNDSPFRFRIRMFPVSDDPQWD